MKLKGLFFTIMFVSMLPATGLCASRDFNYAVYRIDSQQEKIRTGYGLALRNLIGHFGLQVEYAQKRYEETFDARRRHIPAYDLAVGTDFFRRRISPGFVFDGDWLIGYSFHKRHADAPEQRVFFSEFRTGITFQPLWAYEDDWASLELSLGIGDRTYANVDDERLISGDTRIPAQMLFVYQGFRILF